jgi:hypothetical protein
LAIARARPRAPREADAGTPFSSSEPGGGIKAPPASAGLHRAIGWFNRMASYLDKTRSS